MEEVEKPGTAGLPQYLYDPLGILRRRWPWMLAVFLVGVVATTAYVALLEPRYRAEAKLLIASQQISKDYVRPPVETDPLQQLDAMVGEALSSEALARFIEKYALYPDLRASQAATEIAQRMRADIAITPESGITRGRQTALVFAIAFEADRPDVAAAVTNELAELFVSESMRLRTEQGELTTGFLRGELARAEELLREQNRKITEFKEAHLGELPSELETNLGRLERLGQQRESLALQIAEAQKHLATLLSEQDDSPEGQLTSLRLQLEAELAVHTRRHPDVIALEQRIASLEAVEEAASSRSSPIAAARQSLAELRAQQAASEEAIRALDQQVARTPALQAELAALEERETVLRESYMELLRKVQEADLAQSLASSEQGQSLKVLDAANTPAAPTKVRWRYLLAGTLASLALALGTAVLLESLDTVLMTAGQLEALAGTRVLGSVPRIS